jgi:hypothetical protein
MLGEMEPPQETDKAAADQVAGRNAMVWVWPDIDIDIDTDINECGMSARATASANAYADCKMRNIWSAILSACLARCGQGCNCKRVGFGGGRPGEAHAMYSMTARTDLVDQAVTLAARGHTAQGSTLYAWWCSAVGGEGEGGDTVRVCTKENAGRRRSGWQSTLTLTHTHTLTL